jgi:selenide,water dikinase
MEHIIFCKNGGCGAKLGAGALTKVLSKLPKNNDPNLLVGYNGHDDAAVYQCSDDMAIVSTLDFFPPMVEDPYLFGKIAACNALSDIYAMGGEVLTALNIVCFPESEDLNTLGKILQGGNDVLLEAGASLAGGHSIHDPEIKYGLSVTGRVDPKEIYHNNTCQEGDLLLLTKPLGVGIIMAAHRIKEASDEAVDQAITSMTTLNKYARDIIKNFKVHACSDVTGFGFLVHLSEMLDHKFTALILADSIPYFDSCREYVEEFYITAAGQKNRNFIGDAVDFQIDDFIMEEILFDPQTSGGLLVSMPPEHATAAYVRMLEQGIPAKIVGRIVKKQEKEIIVL